MLEAPLCLLEGCRQDEYLRAVLDRHHAADGKACAVARSVNFVEDGNPGITGPEEIGVKRVARALVRHGPHCSDQRLCQHLAAEHALNTLWRRKPAKDVLLDLFQIEERQQPVKRGVSHSRSFQEHLSSNYAIDIIAKTSRPRPATRHD